MTASASPRCSSAARSSMVFRISSTASMAVLAFPVVRPVAWDVGAARPFSTSVRVFHAAMFLVRRIGGPARRPVRSPVGTVVQVPDDDPQGGWWQASDGLWYPPETHPAVAGGGPPTGEIQIDRTPPEGFPRAAPPGPPGHQGRQRP